jgi:hypothetical protein
MTDEEQPGMSAEEPRSTAEPELPRRSSARADVEMPTGYRSSRRSAKAHKRAKRAERQTGVLRVLDRSRRSASNAVWLAAMALGAFLVVALVLMGSATVINSIARWNAARGADGSAGQGGATPTQENVLFIGMDDSRPIGFLATRIDREGGQVFGIAIPDGAFIEVPGQGFERIGDSLMAGPQVALDAVSNYLGVSFEAYVQVPAEAYQMALQTQDMRGVVASATASSLSDEERAALGGELDGIDSENVALVPLPVKPIKLGDQTYFEPQREEVADLLKSWWGVDPTDTQQVTRIIVYNGSGLPGIAGVAAQQLIRAGFRVVDTKNADRFDYAKTQIVVQRGDPQAGERIRTVLGVGEVIEAPADQDVADAIVLIGKDYKPPSEKE